MSCDDVAPPPPYIGRFAPSPSGALHIGSITTALLSYWRARQQNGQWLVRMDDLDPPREVAGAAQKQIECLARFGLISDQPVLYQSQRNDAYEQALKHLSDQKLLFDCHCSRKDLIPQKGIHRYCAPSNTQGQAAVRLRVPEATITVNDLIQGEYTQALHQQVGDVTVKRRDGLYAYTLACVVDDAHQGITEVVRGGDLYGSTPIQIHLQQQLGLQTPKYAHGPLLRYADGEKISKSAGHTSIEHEDVFDVIRFVWKSLNQPSKQLPSSGSLAEWHTHLTQNLHIGLIESDQSRI